LYWLVGFWVWFFRRGLSAGINCSRFHNLSLALRTLGALSPTSFFGWREPFGDKEDASEKYGAHADKNQILSSIR